MGRLQGKVAIVTGGGGGIGSAVVRRMVSEGAKVAVADVFMDSAKAAAETLGDAALAVQFDALVPASIEAMVEATVSHFGRLDILHNNAAMTDPAKHPLDTDAVTIPIDIWDEILDINLRGYLLGCKYAIPHMIAGGGGSIINFGSHLGTKGTEKPAYAAAKGGIMSFTKTLAAQYADYGIRANAIAPAIVRTERSIKRWENKEWLLADNPTPAARARIAMQKLYPFSVGEPEHIAAIAVFLGSDESRMITGTTITADGGRSSYLKVAVD